MTAARWIVISTAMAALLVFWLRPKTPDAAWLDFQHHKLETAIHRAEKQLTSDLKLLNQQTAPIPFFQQKLQNAAPYQLYQYTNDKLTYWSGTFLTPEKYNAKHLTAANPLYFWQDEQYLAAIRQQIDSSSYWLAILPIWQPRPIDSDQLPTGFAAWLDMPDNTTLSPSASTEAAIISTNNAWLNHDGTPNQEVSPWLLGLSALIVLVGLLWLLTLGSEQLGTRLGSWARWVSLIGGIALIRWWSFDFPARWGLPFFEDQLSGLPGTASSGDLLLHSSLLFFLVSYAARQNWITRASSQNGWWRAMLHGSAIVLSVTLLLQLTQTIVLSSGLRFDFDHLLLLDRTRLVVLLSLILLYIAHFLFGYWQYRHIRVLELSQRDRLTAMLAALAPGLLLYLLLPLQVSFPVWLLLGSTLLVLFDLFFEREQPGLTWLVVWLLVYAAMSCGLLFSFSLKSDSKQRLAYAKALLAERDTIASHQLRALTPSQFNLPDEIILKRYQKRLQNTPYLYQNYDVKLIFCRQDSNLRDCAYRHRFRIASDGSFEIPAAADNQLQSMAYVDSTFVVQQATPRARVPSRIYQELLPKAPYLGLTELDDYGYSVYKRGAFQVKVEPVANDWPDMEPGTWTEQLQRYRADLFYKNKQGERAVVSRALGGYLSVFSLFSYLLLLFLMVMLGLFLLHQVLPILPFTQKVRLLGAPSLRNRIQLAVILLTVSSFVIIGVVTVLFFQNSSREYHEGRLQRKVSAVLRDLGQEIEGYPAKADRFEYLKKSIEDVSVTHNLDVHLYGLDGHLLKTSAPFVFEQGLFAPLLSSTAHQQLQINPTRSFIQKEQLGAFNYRVAYVPLLDQGQPLAYLGLPYYSNNRNLRRDVFQFMGTLLNVYVFLLLIAGVIAIAVANSIARPITEIGQKLSSTRLGQNNPLQYQREDELGELIKSYNAMIRQIEESAVKLAQSEREGAWREMAKQVAHEIKNPLTPMKLSIQYLQRAYESDPARAQPLVERVSRTLIEQIDSLSRIASNFSNFAKMPVANNEHLSLNELVASVYDLFRDEQNDQLRISCESTSKALTVFADKDHLQRVLTNLVTNAIQAIPEDRKGEIDIQLYTNGADKAIIEVKDNGKGIPPEQHDKVFVPNFTTKSSGTGLGLAISQGIIEALSGRIYFETIPEQGTSFFVELPLAVEG